MRRCGDSSRVVSYFYRRGTSRPRLLYLTCATSLSPPTCRVVICAMTPRARLRMVVRLRCSFEALFTHPKSRWMLCSIVSFTELHDRAEE